MFHCLITSHWYSIRIERCLQKLSFIGSTCTIIHYHQIKGCGTWFKKIQSLFKVQLNNLNYITWTSVWFNNTWNIMHITIWMKLFKNLNFKTTIVDCECLILLFLYVSFIINFIIIHFFNKVFNNIWILLTNNLLLFTRLTSLINNSFLLNFLVWT